MNFKKIIEEAYKINQLRQNESYADLEESWKKGKAKKKKLIEDQLSWNKGYIAGYLDGKNGRPPRLPFNVNRKVDSEE